MQENNGQQRRLYVGLHDGVCTVSSSDGGKSWTRSPVKPLAHAASRLSASHSHQGRAYLAAYESGLFRTDDAGETWRSLSSYPSDYAHSVMVHPTDPQLVYAGSEPSAIYRSENGGDSWEECGGFRAVPESANWSFHAPTRESHVRDIRIGPVDHDHMYAGVEVGGVIKSRDGGNSWRQLEGLHDDIHCIGLTPHNAQTVYVATARAPYRSDDGGDNWQPINHGVDRPYALHITVAPDNSKIVLVAVSENARRGNPKLLRSTDGGSNWSEVGSVGSGTDASDMVVALDWDPSNAQRLYAATDGGKIFSSEDQGLNWQPLPVNVGRIAVGAMVAAAG